MEPATVSAGYAIGRGMLDFLRYLKGIAGGDTVSAYFKYDGTRIAGSELIEIERSFPNDDAQSPIFWYNVKERADYAFVRYPLIESCAIEIVGTEVGEQMADARFWRWIAPVLPGRIYGSEVPPNLKIDFLVFGYKPKALIKEFSQ